MFGRSGPLSYQHLFRVPVFFYGRQQVGANVTVMSIFCFIATNWAASIITLTISVCDGRFNWTVLYYCFQHAVRLRLSTYRWRLIYRCFPDKWRSANWKPISIECVCTARRYRSCRWKDNSPCICRVNPARHSDLHVFGLVHETHRRLVFPTSHGDFGKVLLYLRLERSVETRSSLSSFDKIGPLYLKYKSHNFWDSLLRILFLKEALIWLSVPCEVRMRSVNVELPVHLTL